MRKLLFFILPFIIFSCNHIPDTVIGEDDMVDLMVDIHKGEAYVEMNSGTFYNDSLKKAFKQSIFIKHGVTSEQFDSSLVWYGHHITEYTKMYEQIIKKLEEQDKEIIAEAKREGELSPLAAGDSIDMWNKSKFKILSSQVGDTIITFDYKSDNDFKKGDRFLWGYRLFSSNADVKVFMGIDYKDGSIGYTLSDKKDEGWNKVLLQSDSTKDVRRVYGYIKFYPKLKQVVYLDSIQLVRTRNNKNNYYSIYSQKSIEKKIPKPKTSIDSLSSKQ